MKTIQHYFINKNLMNTRDTRIVICTRCKGEGFLRIATGDEQIYAFSPCEECGGRGSVKRIVTIEYQQINDNKQGSNGFKQAQNDESGMDSTLHAKNGGRSLPGL